MKIDIETLRKTKGIGSKTLERIIEQHNLDNDLKAYKSTYKPSETYKIDKDINLWQGDCIELMEHIPDKSVDMILCDLPYGTTACSWDTIIPFEPLWDNYKRIIKDNGAIVLFGSGSFTPQIIGSNFEDYKYSWVWIKNNSTNFVHAKNRPMTKREDILVFSKAPMGHKSQLGDSRMMYNPQGIKEVNMEISAGNGKFGSIAGKRPSHKDVFTRTHTGYPVDILEGYPEPHSGTKLHTSQKPVELLEYLVKTYTDEGMIVLDNTMGSGSSGVACKNTNRKFIGIELDEEYFTIASKRILDK